MRGGVRGNNTSNRMQGKMYRQRYWNDTFFDAIEHLKPVAQAHNISLVEIALRWIVLSPLSTSLLLFSSLLSALVLFSLSLLVEIALRRVGV